jgi:signal transduction histidine kinase
MSETPLRVLIVEDNPADAELLELELIKGGYAPSVLRVQTATAMAAALEAEEWDLILCDYVMPRFSSLHALELLTAAEKDIPFILISGTAGEDIAVSAMKAGAKDFFVKGKLALLVSAIQRELREAALRSTARAQREQLQQNEKLAALGTLLAGVAHELNNPLAVIMHQATLLQRALDVDPREGHADKILQAVNRCSRIVNNFLALARNEPARRVTVSVNDVVRAAMDLLAHGLRIDDIEVKVELAEPLPSISGDPHQLQQVLINLVSNAQYELRARPAARTLTVRSGMDADGERVVLRVGDNAGGIPPEIRSRIFDPFFTTKPIGQGTGLGLALCHGIVSAHNGTIAVESETDAGTTFIISLPIGCLIPAHDDNVEPSSPIPSQRILVVDDDLHVASGFSEILSAQGHRVDVAANGRTALQMLDNSVYDLVVSDMHMPECDGPTLYRNIVARHPLLENSFIFVTGAFGAEMDAFLSRTGSVRLGKPCTFDEIENAVRQILRGRSQELDALDRTPSSRPSRA